MTTKLHKLTGHLEWVKLHEPDEYLGVKRWKINIILDEPSLEEYKRSGCRCRLRDHKEGGQFVSLSKSVLAPKWATEWNPPKLTLNGEPFDDLVGNMSKGEVIISVYDTDMGKGHRLESVNVTDLVRYERPSDNEEGNSPQVEETKPQENNEEPW